MITEKITPAFRKKCLPVTLRNAICDLRPRDMDKQKTHIKTMETDRRQRPIRLIKSQYICMLYS